MTLKQVKQLVENEVFVVGQQIVCGDFATCCRANYRGAVSSLKVCLDDFIVATIAKKQNRFYKANIFFWIIPGKIYSKQLYFFINLSRNT